jgi:hypothetical protein
MPDGPDRLRRVCDVPWEHLLRNEFHTVIWPQLLPFIDASLATDPLGRYRAQDVLEYLLSGRLRLWVSYDQDSQSFEMAGVTEIIQFPTCRTCHVWFVGGRNMKAWIKEIVSTVKEYARSENCSHMTTAGRRGWIRAAGWHDEALPNLIMPV